MVDSPLYVIVNLIQALASVVQAPPPQKIKINLLLPRINDDKTQTVKKPVGSSSFLPSCKEQLAIKNAFSVRLF